MNLPIILSLGGSIVVPDAIDTAFVRSFRDIIAKRARGGERFVITVGGGKVCRRYQEAAKELGSPSQADLDWIGIRALSLNAEFIRSTFGASAHDSVIIEPAELRGAKESVVIFGAKAPGHSTDFDAVEAARESSAKRVINLSNIDYVYEKDPKKFPAAKKIEKISWPAFRKLLPPIEKWEPGSNTPFDPVAAKRAEELGLEVVIMNGNNLANLENYLAGKAFTGTVIE
jgi:uridylate kinase